MTRRVRGLGTAVAVVALVALALWWRVPRHRPSLDDDQLYAIDVSHHQGAIDWHKVADDNIDMVYMKATEGGDWVDSELDNYYHDALAAGLDVGLYHYFTLCRPGDEQAANFLAAIDAHPTSLPLAVDFEWTNQCANHPEVEDFQSEVQRFIDTMRAETDRPFLIYLIGNFEASYPLAHLFRADSADNLWWERSLVDRPDNEWDVWQFTAWNRVDGISGSVDVNVVKPSVIEYR